MRVPRRGRRRKSTPGPTPISPRHRDSRPITRSRYNGRAWTWATCPDAKFRDGRKAVESATKACELTDWNEAGLIDTLAAAYAEIGDFASALKWQTKAIELETDAKNKEDYVARSSCTGRKSLIAIPLREPRSAATARSPAA